MAEKRKPQTGLEWLNQHYGMGAVNELLDLAGGFGRNMEQVINRAGGYSPPSRPSGLTEEQQRALIEGPEGAAARLRRINAETEALIERDRNRRLDDGGGGGNPLRTTPIVDRNAARDEVYKQMMQQYGGSTAQEAFGNAPRSGEVDYALRPDIQAWVKANPELGKKFLEKQRAKGLINETTPAFGGTRITMPTGTSDEAVASREQGARMNPQSGMTLTQEAQNAVGRVQADDMAKMFAAGAQLEMPFGNQVGAASAMNRAAMHGEQNIFAQLQKTEAGAPSGGSNMQPGSARTNEPGVEVPLDWTQWNTPLNGKSMFDYYRQTFQK